MTVTDATGQVINVYNGGDKVFNLHRECPISGMFCGMGSIGERSISSLSKELRWELMNGGHPINPKDYTIEQIADRAYEFFNLKYVTPFQDPSHNLEFFVGGYGDPGTHAEIWKMTITSGVLNKPSLLRGEGNHGVDWAGQTSPIMRLLIGIDDRFVQVLTDAGVDQAGARAAFDLARPGLETPMAFPVMPTSDAIRLARFLVDVTKGYFSFAPGADIVGGETDIATITKWEGFRWVKRKHYYPRDLNGGDHGHVC
ncbi:hypothetical protein [Cypionkella sinensis]|uniref:Uncharacterized protein n=1 Tax=Cypionkella sinensis TaxID=1756043 RepID=A0ABV7IX63_9RHOB